MIEEAPSRLSKTEDARSHHVVALSGRSATSLRNNTSRLLDYLGRHPETRLADLAYTTTARRIHQTVRKAYTATSTSELIRFLRNDINKDAAKEPGRRGKNPSRVFAFTGQGGQYAGMGREFYTQSESFRALLRTYQDMAENQSLPYFLDLISDDKLDLASQSPVRVHLAIVALEIAVASMLRRWGIEPDLVMGHSLGEYAALCVAGVLSVSDTLNLVGQRAVLIESKLTPNTFAMVAVRKSATEIRNYLSKNDTTSCEVACLNGPNLTIISGPRKSITDLQSRLASEGSKATLLELPYGFHSQQIEPILQDFEEIAKGVVFLRPSIPVASTLKGAVITDGSVFSPSYLARQAREPVNFTGALAEAKKAGLVDERSSWVEVGPDAICCGLIRQTIDVASENLIPSMKKSENNWKTLSSCLATVYQSGASLGWHVYHKDFTRSLSLLDLPAYAFDEKDYWTSYVEPERVNTTAGAEKAIERPPLPHVPGFPSASLQRIEVCKDDDEITTVIFASNTADPDLFTAIQGHVVDGITACPLSVFCDMALSAANYVHQKSQPNKPVPQMSIHDIELTSPIVVPEPDPLQIAKVTATYRAGSGSVAVNFHSAHGTSTQENGHCEIRFEEEQDWKTSLNQTLFLLKKRIVSLQDLANAGKAHRLLKPVVYRLFSNLVEYGKDYKALEEVILDSEFQDAVGLVKLPAMTGTEKFLHNPYWLDGISHLGGFLLNGSLKYPESMACLSTGFDSWRTLENLSSEKTYTSYVSMQETGQHGMLTGDCFVFDKDNLVMAAMGIKFQKMPRVVLNSILGGSGSASKPTAKPQHGRAKTSQKLQGRMTVDSIPPKSKQATPKRSQSPSSSSDSDGDRNIDTPITPFTDTNTETINTLLALIAAESGYDISEITDDTVFLDMGLDSLMSITITAALKKDIGMELPGTFFVDHPTVGEAKAALGFETEADDEHIVRLESTTDALLGLKPAEAVEEEKEGEQAQLEREPEPAAEPTPPIPSPPPPAEEGPISKTVLLQGSDSDDATKLFLFPDGNGSPAGYVQLPTLSADHCVLGLESPFVKDPSIHTSNYVDLTGAFLRAIKKKQPTGPYNLGGFGFGALFAYGVAQILLEIGDAVDTLVLIDMAIPRTSTTTGEPDRILTTLEAGGLVPAIKRQTPAQKEHWKRTVSTFFSSSSSQATAADLFAPPLRPGRQPAKTVLVTAHSQKEQTKRAAANVGEWFVGGGAEMTTNGWEELLLGQGANVERKQLEAEHMALLRYPMVSFLRLMVLFVRG